MGAGGHQKELREIAFAGYEVYRFGAHDVRDAEQARLPSPVLRRAVPPPTSSPSCLVCGCVRRLCRLVRCGSRWFRPSMISYVMIGFRPWEAVMMRRVGLAMLGFALLLGTAAADSGTPGDVTVGPQRA